MKVLFKYMGCSIVAWFQFFYYNILSSVNKSNKRVCIVPHRNVIIKMGKNAKIEGSGILFIGEPLGKGSKNQTRLMLEDNATLTLTGNCVVLESSFIYVCKNSKLVLGNSFINEHCQITCGETLSIGDKCAIGRDTVIRSFDGHRLDLPEYQIAKSLRIGNHVWIGQGATITKGVTVEDDSVVASGALVTKDVLSHTAVGGNPAKVIKENINWIA